MSRQLIVRRGLPWQRSDSPRMGASQSKSRSLPRFMSTDGAADLSRSPSPSSEGERRSLLPGDIKTIKQLYELNLLNAVPDARVRCKPDSSLLDRVSLVQGDITTLEIDVIVNAANRSLLGGGGVDGAIHSAAGPKLLDECRMLNGCATGEAKMTKGYSLPARHVIHTVGPIYSDKYKEEKAEQLTSCYQTSLELTAASELRHIAFPSISTGIYSYPIGDATRIALDTTRTFLESEQGSKIERVIFVVWSNKDKAVYESIIPEYFPPVEGEDEVLEDQNTETASGTTSDDLQ